MITKAAAASLSSLFLAGCLTMSPLGEAPADEQPADPELPEGAIGAYEVKGQRTSSSCGTGTLALEASWAFEVILGRLDSGEGLTWDVGNGPTDGILSEDGVSFSITGSFVIDMREGSDNSYLAPCSIIRTDMIEGQLDDADDPEAFTGTMSYAFEPTEGSDCVDLTLGEERLAAALPCAATYDVTAKRVLAPADGSEKSQ